VRSTTVLPPLPIFFEKDVIVQKHFFEHFHLGGQKDDVSIGKA
jgi:hypothetical protein